MLVLYDRDCGFCGWMLARLLRWDRARRLRCAPIQGPEGDRWLAAMPGRERLASWHAVDAEGTVRSGGAALTQVLRLLPGGLILAALTARLPGLTERGYAAVAANRRALARPLSAAAKQRAWALVAEREGRPVADVGPSSAGASCSIGVGGSCSIDRGGSHADRA